MEYDMRHLSKFIIFVLTFSLICNSCSIKQMTTKNTMNYQAEKTFHEDGSEKKKEQNTLVTILGILAGGLTIYLVGTLIIKSQK